MPETPIDVSGLPGRYANALFELADEQGVLDAVMDDLAALRAMIREAPDFARVLTSPVIGRDEQSAAVDAVMERAGIGELARRFVNVVARNRRLFALPGMIEVFRALLAARRGEIAAEVTSAGPLSETQRAALEQALARSVGANVSIDLRVDPAILGGLVVKVGSRMVDSSLRTKLDKLQISMKGAA